MALSSVILAREGDGPYVTHVTTGKIVDKGIKDANNMGAARARNRGLEEARGRYIAYLECCRSVCSAPDFHPARMRYTRFAAPGTRGRYPRF